MTEKLLEKISVSVLKDKWRKKRTNYLKNKSKVCIEYSRVETNRAKGHI